MIRARPLAVAAFALPAPPVAEEGCGLIAPQSSGARMIMLGRRDGRRQEEGRT